MGVITIEVKELGITEISIEPWQLVFRNEDDQVVGVQLSNEIIINAADEIKGRLIVNDIKIKTKILDWFATGKVGVSSKVMACVAAGLPVSMDFPPYHPSDPDDLNRCLLLLEKVPEIREHFNEIAKVSDEWAALIKKWDDVERCFITEVGLNWCNGGKAIKTYNLMKEIQSNPGEQNND